MSVREESAGPAGAAGRRAMRRLFPDRWSVLFGQLAACSFVVLLVTGVFLTLFYVPDMTQVRYDGSYDALRGTRVSRAYESTVRLSLEVRGGLLMRQMHHWAALIFTAAICCHLVRLFVTGAYRYLRRVKWLGWVSLLPLAMVAGVTGTLLPDDMLSGGSLGLIQGITQSIPVVGTRLTFWLFGGEIPGGDIIPRAYWLHIIVLPAAMVALPALWNRRFAGWRRPRRPRRSRRPAVPGRPEAFEAARLLDRTAMFLFTCAVVALLGTIAQINPVWLIGPYEPGAITAGAVPGWYMGFLDGAIRIMPGWEFSIAGHPLTVAVLVPALVVPGAFFTLLAGYPWLERRIQHRRASRAAGDRLPARALDRPREAAARTGICAAGIAFYGLLWAAAANDQIAVTFNLSLYGVTWFFRIAVFAGPALAFILTRRLCQALLDRERQQAEHGYETGRVVMGPAGDYHEIHRPVPKARELSR